MSMSASAPLVTAFNVNSGVSRSKMPAGTTTPFRPLTVTDVMREAIDV